MNREKFTYLCLTLSIIGLAILQLSTTVLKPETVPVQSVDESDVGTVVKIEGNVTGFYSTDSASFFTLEDRTGKIPVVNFQKLKLRNGQNVSVLGNVELRRGNLQLVSSKIEQN